MPTHLVSTVMSGQCAVRISEGTAPQAGKHQALAATRSRVPSLKCMADKRHHQELDQENTKGPFLTIYETPPGGMPRKTRMGDGGGQDLKEADISQMQVGLTSHSCKLAFINQ